jgi:hypothetical protein
MLIYCLRTLIRCWQHEAAVSVSAWTALSCPGPGPRPSQLRHSCCLLACSYCKFDCLLYAYLPDLLAVAAVGLLVAALPADHLAEVSGASQAVPTGAAAATGAGAAAVHQYRSHPTAGAAAATAAGKTACIHTASPLHLTGLGAVATTREIHGVTTTTDSGQQGIGRITRITLITTWGGMVQRRCTVSRWQLGRRIILA